MLISRISDENEGAGEGNGIEVERVNSQEYQAASELFELMTKNVHFDDNDNDTLSTQDVVLLYKNIDKSTRLMSDATNVRRRKPNQYVETVVYNDEPESDSDLSENFSSDDLHNVFKINQERLNLFDNGSFDNILCHKLGGLEIKSSDFSTDYNRQFLFKDPYIKEQLKGLNGMASCSEFENLFPTSLLDYICCKRLEDNYNFYMDNIIRYVQHTIEQLKRISNGDYLTDRAKEKWEEVKKYEGPENSNSKIRATSTSIPLHVECKKRGNTTWDDIVHSEVDVRSLSKILEKKIVVEIPKLICGSYRLFSKRCDDNLIISCKREKEDEESRLDVVLKLQRSKTGQVISNISSIMILQTSPAVQDLRIAETLPITYKKSNDETVIAHDDSKENTITIIDCANDDNDLGDSEMDTTAVIEEVVTEVFEDGGSQNAESNIETIDYPFSDPECVVPYDITSNQYSSESSVALRDILVDQFDTFPNQNEASFLVSPDDLRVTMQRLNMQSSLPEESGEEVSLSQSSKKKSPVRIKSPYENKSYILEEKKRKRLLEIREKREKKKMALSENAKVSKHKYGKGVTPQASNSVTKLSITNKSFYNSIYGHNLNDGKSLTKIRKGFKKDSLIFEVPIDQVHEEYCESPNLTPDKNSKKYINRSYYLDDTETEVMHMEMTQDARATCSASTSAVSNEFSANLNLLSQLIGPSETDFNKEETVEEEQTQSLDDDIYNNSKDAGCSYDIPVAEISVPVNSPKAIVCELENDDNEPKKLPVTIQCKKSIDKLYSLMKKLGKGSATDVKTSKSKLNVRTVEKFDATTGASTVQGSDSGTSLKHHPTSSNPSCFSFGKTNAENSRSRATTKIEQATTVVPKVIISSKLQTAKIETDKLKKNRKRVIICPPTKTVPENPLKAISQLLHEFDNVQKTRQKAIPEGKPSKKPDIAFGDGKPSMSRQNSFRRRSRLDQHLKENDQDKKVAISTPKEKRLKPLTPLELKSKIPHQQTASEDKHIEKVTKKKIADIIDEAKEARGEAVRGPSKLNSRLHSLSQPKRSYVQAHSEEYQHKYGKNLMADRLQRLATTAPPPPLTEPITRNVSSPTARNKVKREATSNVSVKQSPPSVQPIDKPGRVRRRSVSNSPNRKSPAPSARNHNCSEAPDTMNKILAVESYVKNHYDFGSPPPSELLLAGHKSRLPLLPSDIELASITSSPAAAEEANELGKKLHRIIDSMVVNVPPLTSLTECHETVSKISRENTDDSMDKLSRNQRTDSEYNIDILQDKNLETAVESHSSNKHGESVDEIFGIPDTLNHELQPLNSTAELEILENALYNQISGVFQKRLRLKNLTLTPKQSVQQVFLLQSGDAGSVLVKSTASSLKIKCDESLHDLKAVRMLSDSHVNWNFAQIPMQLATVGYAFPVYQSDCGTKHDLKSLSVSRTVISEHGSMNSKSDKISQCFKGVHQEPKSEQAAQVYVNEITDISKIIDGTEQTITKIWEHMNVPTTKETTEVIDESLLNIPEESLPVIDSSIDKQVPPSSPDHVGYTTSLDMLVGLLNEIQKITCQNPVGDQSPCTELETILCNAAALEDDRPRELVSMTSLDKLRQLESNPSIYSFYISSAGSPSSGCIKTEPAVNKPIFVDKEVSVNIIEKEVVNTFTDVPSLVPIVVDNSTNVTNSIIGVISEPSTQSIISFTDYHTLYSNTFFSSQSIKKIIELPRVESNKKLKESKKTDLNEKCCEIASPACEIERLPEHKCALVVNRIKKKPIKVDLIKIKRDILVTVYSILVFTVFAALTLPDMALFEL